MRAARNWWNTCPPSLRAQRALTGALRKGVMPKLMVSSSLIRRIGWIGQNWRLSRPSVESSAAARLRHDGTPSRLMPVWSKCSRGWRKAYSIKTEIRARMVTKGIRQSLNYLCSISGGEQVGHTHLSEAVLVIKLG